MKHQEEMNLQEEKRMITKKEMMRVFQTHDTKRGIEKMSEWETVATGQDLETSTDLVEKTTRKRTKRVAAMPVPPNKESSCVTWSTRTLALTFPGSLSRRTCAWLRTLRNQRRKKTSRESTQGTSWKRSTSTWRNLSSLSLRVMLLIMKVAVLDLMGPANPEGERGGPKSEWMKDNKYLIS